MFNKHAKRRSRPVSSHVHLTSLFSKRFVILVMRSIFLWHPMQEISSGKDGPILPARVTCKKKQDSLYLVVHATESSYSLDLSCMFYGIFFSVFI